MYRWQHNEDKRCNHCTHEGVRIFRIRTRRVVEVYQTQTTSLSKQNCRSISCFSKGVGLMDDLTWFSNIVIVSIGMMTVAIAMQGGI